MYRSTENTCIGWSSRFFSTEFFSYYTALLSVCLLLRILLISDIYAYFSSLEDLKVLSRGVAFDAVVSFILTCFMFVIRMSIIAKNSISLIYVFLVIANFEHIRFNGSNMDISFSRYVVQKNFIFGSIFTATIFLVSYLSITIFFFTQRLIVRLSEFSLQRLSAFRFVLYSTLLLMGPCFISTNHLYPQWMQHNFVVDQLISVLGVKNKIEEKNDFSSEHIAAVEIEHEFFVQDLNGTMHIDRPSEMPNIIMIVVEALSYEHLNSGYTPFLDGLAKENMLYTQFINHQRITTNGMYALWCGDYPNLLSMDTKSEVLLNSQSFSGCLPEILSNYGYSSYFMQSADLGYMDKDKLAESAGFDEMWGGRTLPIRDQENGWGVSDSDLFSSAEVLMDKKSKDEQPFFLSLLNVGTHHPYPDIPDDIEDNYDSRRDAAFFYTDTLIRRFYRKLEKKNMLGNSIILVTSDESGMVSGKRKIPGSMLPSNHGVMIAVTPNRERKNIVDLFTQRDIVLSILDYIDVPMPDKVVGRSIFRDYDSFRRVAFSNAFLKTAFVLSEPNLLISCGYSLDYCYKHEFSGNLFDTEYKFYSNPASIEDKRAVYFLGQISDVKYANSNYIVSKENLNISESKFLYHMRRMESSMNNSGEWFIEGYADSKNRSPVTIDFFVKKAAFINKYSRTVELKSILLQPGESVSYKLVEPFTESGIIYDSTLGVEIESEGDSFFVTKISIRKNNRTPAIREINISVE